MITNSGSDLRWSRSISNSDFDKRYFVSQNCIWNKNTLFTGQIHKYDCALNAVLLHDANSMVIILQIHKSINEYVL